MGTRGTYKDFVCQPVKMVRYKEVSSQSAQRVQGGVWRCATASARLTCEGSRHQKRYLVIVGPTYKHVQTAETYLNKLIFTHLTCNFFLYQTNAHQLKNKLNTLIY